LCSNAWLSVATKSLAGTKPNIELQ
jgi:hypothetical protein